MQIELLDTFLDLVETRSFHRTADRLGVTVAAVKWHLQHIYEKLHVHSRTAAALKFKQGQDSEN